MSTGSTKTDYVKGIGLAAAVCCWALIAQSALAQSAQPQASGSNVKGQHRQNLKSRMWWNQGKKVQELGLSAEQRASMDESLDRFLETRKEGQNNQKQLMTSFGTNLSKGDFEAAEAQADSVTGASSETMRQQLGMMLEVVQVLTKEQRDQLVAGYPKLLSQLWIASGNGRIFSREARGRN